MSNTFFEYNKEYVFQGRGSLIKITRNMENISISNCITESIELYKNINKEYLKSIANDGKIIGLERSRLLDLIDEFFNMLIMVWKKLIAGSGISKLKIENTASGFVMHLKEKDLIWEAQGKLSMDMIRPVKNFSTLFNKELSSKIKNFLNCYKESCEDGVLDSKERKKMQNELEEVFYYCLFLRFQVELCLVGK